MEDNKLQCEGCGRNCFITLKKENNEYYIEGNKCIGGEEQAKSKWGFLKQKSSLENPKKKGFLKKLFNK